MPLKSALITREVMDKKESLSEKLSVAPSLYKLERVNKTFYGVPKIFKQILENARKAARKK